MTIDEAKSKVLDRARAEIGYHEQGNNITKFASAYDFDNRLYGFDMNGQPWCDWFVDWLFMVCFGYEIGSAMAYQFSGCSGAACSSSASYYRCNNAFYASPEIGDQIFFYVNGDINHTGIVEKIENGYITTIEGNSSDMVRRNQYPIGHSTIAGFGRPAWKYASNTSAQTVQECTECSDSTITLCQSAIAQNTLENGSTGHLVTALQAILNYYGADLDMDSEFGRLTEQALIKYQKTHDLEADGICGEKTWRSF